LLSGTGDLENRWETNIERDTEVWVVRLWTGSGLGLQFSDDIPILFLSHIEIAESSVPYGTEQFPSPGERARRHMFSLIH
jgi:hypothetical protein